MPVASRYMNTLMQLASCCQTALIQAVCNGSGLMSWKLWSLCSAHPHGVSLLTDKALSLLEVHRPVHPPYSSVFVSESNTEYWNAGLFVSLWNRHDACIIYNVSTVFIWSRSLFMNIMYLLHQARWPNWQSTDLPCRRLGVQFSSESNQRHTKLILVAS